MPGCSRPFVAALLVGGATAVAMIGAPIASGAGADAEIADLEAQGYSVQINWLNGFNTQPLSQCTMVGVNNPDHSGAPPEVGDTVYVDVRCPNHPDVGGDISIGGGGIGVGIG